MSTSSIGSKAELTVWFARRISSQPHSNAIYRLQSFSLVLNDNSSRSRTTVSMIWESGDSRVVQLSHEVTRRMTRLACYYASYSMTLLLKVLHISGEVSTRLVRQLKVVFLQAWVCAPTIRPPLKKSSKSYTPSSTELDFNKKSFLLFWSFHLNIGPLDSTLFKIITNDKAALLRS